MSINAFFSKWINWWNGNPFTVSFMVHCWITNVFVYHVAKNFPQLQWPLVIGLVALTAWKEFYWDHKNEPDHSAWPQGATDFGGYLFGIATALAFIYTGT